MRVVYTDEALRDIDEISAWLTVHYPGLGAAVERRIRLVVAQSRAGRTACAARVIARAFALRRSAAIRTRFSTAFAGTRWRFSMSTTRRGSLGTKTVEQAQPGTSGKLTP